jgi:hypothetical protein
MGRVVDDKRVFNVGTGNADLDDDDDDDGRNDEDNSGTIDDNVIGIVDG